MINTQTFVTSVSLLVVTGIFIGNLGYTQSSEVTFLRLFTDLFRKEFSSLLKIKEWLL